MRPPASSRAGPPIWRRRSTRASWRAATRAIRMEIERRIAGPPGLRRQAGAAGLRPGLAPLLRAAHAGQPGGRGEEAGGRAAHAAAADPGGAAGLHRADDRRGGRVRERQAGDRKDAAAGAAGCATWPEPGRADPELAAEIRRGRSAGRALAADDAATPACWMRSAAATPSERAFVEQVGRLVAAEASVERFVSAVDRRIDAAPPRPRGRRAALPAGRSLVAPAGAGCRGGGCALAAGHTPDRRSPGALPGRASPATVVTGTLHRSQGRLRRRQPSRPRGQRSSSDEGRACLRPGRRQPGLPGARVADAAGAGRRRDRRPRGRQGGGHRAAPAAAGATFTIGTAAGEVTAIGTAFSVELADGGASVVTRVVQGRGRRRHRRARPASDAGDACRRTRRWPRPAAARWRMSSEEEREEWSLVRGPRRAGLPGPGRREESAPGRRSPTGRRRRPPAGAEVPALLRLADALRARGRLRDAQGICDGLARRFPGRPEIEGIAAELRRPPARPALERHPGGLPDQRRAAAATSIPGATSGRPTPTSAAGTAASSRRRSTAPTWIPLYRSERFAFPGEELAYHLPVRRRAIRRAPALCGDLGGDRQARHAPVRRASSRATGCWRATTSRPRSAP